MGEYMQILQDMEWTPLGKAPKELIQEWQRNIPVEGMSKTFNNPLTGKPLFTVPEDLSTTLPDTQTTDSGFIFSRVLKKLLLFSITHWVKPK